MRVSKTILKNGQGRYAPFVMLEAVAVHAHNCRSCTLGKKHGPCNCGAVELWEQVKDYLTAFVESAETFAIKEKDPLETREPFQPTS